MKLRIVIASNSLRIDGVHIFRIRAASLNFPLCLFASPISLLFSLSLLGEKDDEIFLYDY